MPIIAVGSLNATTGEKALLEKKADLVAIGRGLIADPELPNKLAASKMEDIRPCILCNEKCAGNGVKNRSMRCTVNPATGREASFRMTPASKKKKVMVIGGGIAGMEAARTAAIRGHDVTLVEKGNQLGGHLIEASAPKFKGTLKELLVWAQKQIDKSSIKIQLNTEATPSLVKRAKPDVLIIAVGSGYAKPAVPGSNKTFVVTAKDALLGQKRLGKRVVVIGGGTVGCETALHIAEELRNKVTIIEMLDDILVDHEPIHQIVLRERLQAAGVDVHTGWVLKEITDEGISCEDRNWRMHDIAADTVIIATGLEPMNSIVEKFDGLVSEVYIIGDCVRARRIHNAFEDAWWAVLRT